MTPGRYRQVVALFEAACSLPPEAREAHLIDQCGEDVELRRAVEAMLAQDERRSLLRTTATNAPGLLALQALSADGAEAPVPERLGGYRILGVIGTGAMGTVYRAEQQHPRREVALKTIHWWTLSPQAIERFRFEAQALAQLQHPGIPQIYEVAEDAEHLSFAMELVEGQCLTEYAAALGGDVRRVLALVADIADAVHHAHLRGLVHRDLKPDNIRITAAGQPKVLDFGISLPVAVGGGVTRLRDVAGTLAYMSPEQLWPEGGIDIRADVYALGVIVYELLCGERPFRLADLSFEQARAHLRDAVVVPPGERRRALRGEVSSIVSRAMAPRREERYASAAELAEDLRRCLRHEPVRAHPGGMAYRASRFARRNRVAVAAGAFLFLALAGGGGTSLVLFRQAEAARAREATQRAEAEAARDRAQRETAKAAASVDFLSELLMEADPHHSLGRPLSVPEALDRAAQRLEKGSLDARPEVEAPLRLTLAKAYRGLGLEEQAAGQEFAAAKLEAKGRLGQSEEAAAVLRAVAVLQEKRGELPEARAAISRCLAIEHTLHPGAHPDVVYALTAQGRVLREIGEFAAGEAAFREALSQARALVAAGELPGVELSSPLEHLAILLANVGRYDEAEALLRESLTLVEAHYGPEHVDVASTLHNIAWVMKEEGRGGEAWPLLERALAIRTRVLGRRHARVAIQLALHGFIAMDTGDLELAERSMREAMEILVAVYGPDHPQVVINRIGEARLLLLRGQFAAAQTLAEAIAARHRQRYGAAHWRTAWAETLAAQAMVAQGQRGEGIALLRRCLATLQAHVGPNARVTRDAATALEQAQAAARARE